MAIKINNNTIIDNNKNGSFDICHLNGYTLQQLRDKDVTGTEVGDFVYNTDTQGLSFWTGSEWNNTTITLSGGNLTWQSGGYTYHQFTSSGNIVTNGPISVEALIIAGGAGGGSGRFQGGGGAGGFRIIDVPLSTGTTQVTVGAGGAGGVPWPGSSTSVAPPLGRGQNGSDSSIGSFVSNGGGGTSDSHGVGGGSGGGAVVGGNGGSGNTPPTTPPQGNDGGSVPGSWPGTGIVATGGGGAGGAGADIPSTYTTGGIGGRGLLISEFGPLSGKYPGVSWTITPSIPTPEQPRWNSGVAGGGSGAYSRPNPYSAPYTPANPVGGGGYGRYPTGGDAFGYGAGGGGGGFYQTTNTAGGDGYPGIVIIRYLTSSLQ